MALSAGRGRLAVAVAGVVAAAAVVAFLELRPAPEPVPTPPGSSAPNVILISLDTLRADRLGSYGHHRDTSPVLDALAARSTLFESAWAPTPWTLPSHVGMLTGRHPFEVGIKDSTSMIPADVALVTEMLSHAGYQTGAFVDSKPDGLVGGDRGFARGFDTYHHVRGGRRKRFAYLFERHRTLAEEWLLERDEGRPFFLFLHTKAVHAEPARFGRAPGSTPLGTPYRKPEPYQSMFVTPEQAKMRWQKGPDQGVLVLVGLNDDLSNGRIRKEDYPDDRLRALEGFYEGGIRSVDDQLGELLGFLEEQGLADDTAIIVTADHGEAFLEHRFFLHRELRPQVLQVPLVVHLPGQTAGARLKNEVWLEDVAPTLVDLAGLPTQPAMTGRSLLDPPSARGPRFAYYQFRSDYNYYAQSAQVGEWKLVVERVGKNPSQRVTSLYNTVEDPGELRPIEDPERTQELQGLLREWVDEHRGSAAPELGMSEETLERLHALGYVN